MSQRDDRSGPNPPPGPPGNPAPFGPMPPGASGPFGPGPGHFGPPGAQPGWGPGGIQRGQPTGPQKKSRLGLFIGCGCLGLFLFVLSVGGFLLYFEEGKGIHVPDSEVSSVPVLPGEPFTIDFVWDGTSWAFNNVWLVIEDGEKSGGAFEIESRVTCDRTNREAEEKIKVPSAEVMRLEDRGSSFSAWIYLTDEYERSSPRKVTCTGTVTPTKGTWTKAHIAVTQRQRPSDFFAF